MGPTILKLGQFAGDVPAQFSVALGASYSLHFGKLALDLGPAASFTPTPYTGPRDDTEASARMFLFLANAAARYRLGPRLDARAELGAGVLVWSGFDEDNPFTDPDRHGGITAGAVRAGLGADFALTGHLVISLTGAYSYSSKKIERFSSGGEITSISRTELLLGVGYTL